MLKTNLQLIVVVILAGCIQETVPLANDPHQDEASREVIEIDVARLVAGDMRYNIRIYDGDEIWPSNQPRDHNAKPVDLTPDRVRAGGIGEWQPLAHPLYRIKPGDTVLVTIYELRTPGVDDQQQRRVDNQGQLRLAIVGPLDAAGRSFTELEVDIAKKLENAGKLRDATVTVQMLTTQQKFTVVRQRAGSWSSPPGTHAITKSELRLIEALEIDKTTLADYKYLYVVRAM